MYHRLLLMSLFSILFGCGKRSTDKEKYPHIPHFPLTDNPACQVEAVPIPDSVQVHAFIFSPDKQSIYVLTYGPVETPEQMPYHLFRLDSGGDIQAKTTLPDKRWSNQPLLYWEENGLLTLVLPNAAITTFDPVSLKTTQEWQVITTKNFLPSRRLQQLTFDEQRDAYREAREQAIRKCDMGFWVLLPAGNLNLLALEYSSKPGEAWQTPSDEAVDTRFPLKKRATNPDAQQFAGEKTPEPNDQITDGIAGLKFLARDVFDYKINYPNLRDIESRIFEISSGKRVARFKLSNKDKHSLQLQLSDDQYLTTSDGALWLIYEGLLYRIAFSGQ